MDKIDKIGFWKNIASQDLSSAESFYRDKIKPILKTYSFRYPKLSRMCNCKLEKIHLEFSDPLRMGDIRLKLLERAKEFESISEFFREIGSDDTVSLDKILLRYIEKFDMSYKAISHLKEGT